MDKKTIITPSMLLAYAILKGYLYRDTKYDRKKDNIKTVDDLSQLLTRRRTSPVAMTPIGQTKEDVLKEAKDLKKIENIAAMRMTTSPPPDVNTPEFEKYLLQFATELKQNDFETRYIRNATYTGREYKALEIEGKEREVKINEQQQQVERLQEQEQKLNTQLKLSSAQIKKLETSKKSLSTRLAKKNGEIDELKRQQEYYQKTNNKSALKKIDKSLKKSIEEQQLLKNEMSELTKTGESLGQDVAEIKGDVKTVMATTTDIQRQIDALPRTIRGTQRELIQPREYKYDEGRTGLGLNPAQRKKLKAIVAKETRAEIADAVDMIAGDEINATPSQIMTALTGIALSVAIPIPSPVLGAILDRLSRETGFDAWFNSMFEDSRISDSNNRILTQRATVTSLEQIEEAQPRISPIDAKTETIETKAPFDFEQAIINEVRNIERGPSEGKQDAGPGSIDLIGKADQKQQRDNRGRFIKKIADTQAGAVLGGAATYAITGSVASAVTGAGVGGLVGALSPAISRIGEALAERLPDTIPTTTGIQRAVQRQITTDTKDVNIPIPTLSRRGANPQELATYENEINELNMRYNELMDNEEYVNRQMVINSRANLPVGVLTNQARRISREIRENRDRLLQIEAEVERGPRARIDIDRKGVGIPIPRRTTDEEKALVPFNEAEERTTYDKKKALAVAGAVGSAVVAAGVEQSGMFKERPIEVPTEIFSQQQDQTARGLLRPKFIMPSADILQPSNQELAADALEFAMFDFVEPSSEGAEGTNQTNILKAFQKENENIRYRNAGVVVNSLFGNDANDLTTQQITKMFLGPELPPLIFSEIQQNLSEYEVSSFDVNNELTGIEFFSPYNNFTNVNPGLGENMSMLFDVVP